MKSFSVQVVIRVSLLLLTMLCLAYIFGRADLFFNHIILFGLLVLQVIALIRYVHRTNRELAKLLISIKNNDFTASFNSMKNDRQFKDLHLAFRDIIQAYKDAKIEKEAQYEYLRLIVRHIKVGIVSVKGNDEIALINQTALDILQMETYHHWHNLKNSHAHFVEQVDLMHENESKLIEVLVHGEVKRLSVQVTSVLLMRQLYRIITFQDIAQELNQGEIDAWHKLIRILTHEIMNSVTPVSSLSETMLQMLRTSHGTLKKPDEVDSELLEDLAYSLRTIQKRSDGLLAFVEDYRKLTKLPQPQPERILLSELLKDIYQLMRAELQKSGIAATHRVSPEDLHVWADRRLLEQVLINLLTNSCHALQNTHDPSVEISAREENTRVVLRVSDNGPGIPLEKLDKIFVPFFSTKQQGSGIGLSLSRNIMSLHGGTIRVNAPHDGPTVFSLSFPLQQRAKIPHPQTL